jgi:hypothetical protein
MTIRIYPLGELCAVFSFVYFVFRLFLYHKVRKVCHEEHEVLNEVDFHG